MTFQFNQPTTPKPGQPKARPVFGVINQASSSKAQSMGVESVSIGQSLAALVGCNDQSDPPVNAQGDSEAEPNHLNQKFLQACHHHRVIQRLHQVTDILPARLGLVYSDRASLIRALPSPDFLNRRLGQLADHSEVSLRLDLPPSTATQPLWEVQPSMKVTGGDRLRQAFNRQRQRQLIWQQDDRGSLMQKPRANGRSPKPGWCARFSIAATSASLSGWSPKTGSIRQCRCCTKSRPNCLVGLKAIHPAPGHPIISALRSWSGPKKRPALPDRNVQAIWHPAARPSDLTFRHPANCRPTIQRA